MTVFPALALMLATNAPAGNELAAQVQALFDDACTVCHDASGDPADPGGLDLESPIAGLVGKVSVVNRQPLVVAGDPSRSYLVAKIEGHAGIAGERMPLDEAPMTAAQLELVRAWIASLPVNGATPGDAVSQPSSDPGTSANPGPPGSKTPPDTHANPGANASQRAGEHQHRGSAGSPPNAATSSMPPFHGTTQVVLPTTATLGARTLQYRIDHRFGRMGAERGAFGLDVGANISFALAYGIFDGWDVRLRRTNSRKGWELGTTYVPIRQDAGQPVSFGGYASIEFLRDFDVANAWTGNVMLMLSRLWFQRWSTMLTVGYHFDTNHNTRVVVDLGDGPVAVRDERDTMTLGLASTVWLGKRKRWGVDMEYFLPIPDGADPNAFYYRGGDADPQGSKIGSWALGGSYKIGLHFFQVFLTNNREIHTNLAAPGGQSGNPFSTPGVDSKNPFHHANFFLGFNLARKFKL